jgi:hypothetical protein
MSISPNLAYLCVRVKSGDFMNTRRAANALPNEASQQTPSQKPIQLVRETFEDSSIPTKSTLNDHAPGESKALAEDNPEVDRRIIEGMLRDREALFGEMATLGIGKNDVLRRAAELGLSEALIRQLRGVAADLAGDRQAGRRPVPSSLGARTCLSCDRIFLSSGPGNRLCMRCRGGDAGLAQL